MRELIEALARDVRLDDWLLVDPDYDHYSAVISIRYAKTPRGYNPDRIVIETGIKVACFQPNVTLTVKRDVKLETDE